MTNTKIKILKRSILGGVTVCTVSSLTAYIWSLNTFLSGLLVMFVAVVSLLSGFMLTLIIQLLFYRCSRQTATIITILIFIILLGLGLWGYNF